MAKLADSGADIGLGEDDVARALALGYFRNFAVPAVQIAQRDNQLMVILQPRSMGDLSTYVRDSESSLRTLFEADAVPLVVASRDGVSARRGFVGIMRAIPGQAPDAPFLFDAPTTLFVLDDLFATVNLRRAVAGDSPLTAEDVAARQGRQFGIFFDQLDSLFQSEIGLTTVADIVADLEVLRSLRPHLQMVELATVIGWYRAK